MKKYQASTPDAKVIGAALLAYNEASLHDTFKDVLAEYGLSEIDPEMWYPQQLTLDVQKSIKSQAGGGQSLISIGMKIIETAHFPPMDSLTMAIEAFASSYPMNFQDQSPDDIIRAEQVDDDHFQVINCSPHSDEMIYGYVYALARRFAPAGKKPIVEFESHDVIDGDGDTIINVTLR